MVVRWKPASTRIVIAWRLKCVITAAAATTTSSSSNSIAISVTRHIASVSQMTATHSFPAV